MKEEYFLNIAKQHYKIDEEEKIVFVPYNIDKLPTALKVLRNSHGYMIQTEIV